MFCCLSFRLFFSSSLLWLTLPVSKRYALRDQTHENRFRLHHDLAMQVWFQSTKIIRKDSYYNYSFL